ncbi:type III-B CRISPR module-associated protein Cmr5 [Thiohalobacter sp.]|uniref:type III-B CRISPR module-associated protein Cmr5 n=1 Tax=Thiohalobacter sp. TaxID=2025948 RepID=UPI0026368654|nr:type III-B CRISPR module-associated protein Cmr5 [Thiohalobacter sp.]
MRQTMEQRRAAHAWDCALAAKQALERGNGKDGYKDYINAAKGMPALIMNSGLMQVMAYNQGKKEERYGLLSAHLRDWLRKSLGTPDDFRGFMQYLLKADPPEFQAITAEAFAWLRWLRQVAPALEREDA